MMSNLTLAPKECHWDSLDRALTYSPCCHAVSPRKQRGYYFHLLIENEEVNKTVFSKQFDGTLPT